MTSLDEAVYRDSGLPWVGPIPSEWQTVPLMSIAVERNEKNGGMLENNLLSLSYGRIVRKDIEANDGLLPESFETYQIVHPGDVVFRLTDLQNDKRSLRTALVEERGIITSAYLAVRAVGVQPNYLGYLLRSYDLSKVFYSMGGGLRQSMKFDDLKRLPLVLPPIDEQTAIAAFLDRETAKIDALVGEQKRLIDLLKEKRQAVISHAVTKGLNPDVPMKDSGIEWLGEVPEHWEVAPLKRWAVVQTGVAKGKDLSDVETINVPYLRVANVQDSYIDLTEVANIDIAANALERFRLRAGDVLMNEGGDFDKLGRGHIWNGEIDPCIHQNHVFAVRPHGVMPEWLNYFTSSSTAQFYFMLNSKQSTNLASISSSNLMELPVPRPPRSEQELIISSIERQLSELTAMRTLAEQSTDFLQERRAALISAAVTGKIDVRRTVEEEVAA